VDLEALEDRDCPSSLTWTAGTTTLKYQAALGEFNRLTVTSVFDMIKGNGVSFSDSGTIIGLPLTINCANPPFEGGNAPGVPAVFWLAQGLPGLLEVHLGDEDDTLSVNHPVYTIAFGHAGNDDMSFFGATGVSAWGGFGHDNLSGSEYADMLDGEGNQDAITGMGGNDRIFGGDDRDVLYGFADNDQLFGGDGQDTLFGGAGDDELDGGLDGVPDWLWGDADGDVFYWWFEDVMQDYDEEEGDSIFPPP
jgi:Ca2+-binding RTX toxin-like protein